MFKQVFRVAFVTLIWKQYKHVIVSTVLLFVFLFLVSNIHSDFLTHAKLQGSAADTGLSFIYKWLAFVTGVVAYFGYHIVRSKRQPAQKKAKEDKKNERESKQKQLTEELQQLDEDNDPFAAIRARKKLRGRADFLIDQEKG